MKHPIGAFLGALVFVLLQTFAIDVIDRERFNLVIGGVFLAIVLFSPDGLLGLWAKLRFRFGSKQTMTFNTKETEVKMSKTDLGAFVWSAPRRPRR